MKSSLINTRNLYSFLDIEPLIIISLFLLGTWLFYKLFLREVSSERHLNIKNHFASILRHFFILIVLFTSFYLLHEAVPLINELQRILMYIALLTLAWGIVVFVKISRLMVLQYLFLGSMREGVPVLIVNIFSLILSIIISIWCLTQIIGIQIAPLLATSAAFSVILGLAMQDTLGNLFAGISLQIDNSFEIGDWIEISNNGQKIIGQVYEISWRAITLLGWADETIIVPNKALSNSQITNYSIRNTPLYRSLIFKFEPTQNIEAIKNILISSTHNVTGISKSINTVVYLSDAGDGFINNRLIFAIDDYGLMYKINDEVTTKVLNNLTAAGIKLAVTQIKVSHD